MKIITGKPMTTENLCGLNILFWSLFWITLAWGGSPSQFAQDWKVSPDTGCSWLNLGRTVTLLLHVPALGRPASPALVSALTPGTGPVPPPWTRGPGRISKMWALPFHGFPSTGFTPNIPNTLWAGFQMFCTEWLFHKWYLLFLPLSFGKQL